MFTGKAKGKGLDASKKVWPEENAWFEAATVCERNPLWREKVVIALFGIIGLFSTTMGGGAGPGAGGRDRGWRLEGSWVS